MILLETVCCFCCCSLKQEPCWRCGTTSKISTKSAMTALNVYAPVWSGTFRIPKQQKKKQQKHQLLSSHHHHLPPSPTYTKVVQSFFLFPREKKMKLSPQLLLQASSCPQKHSLHHHSEHRPCLLVHVVRCNQNRKNAICPRRCRSSSCLLTCC